MPAPTTKFSPLRSLDDALADLLAHVQPLTATEVVATFDADRRVLGSSITSNLQVPGFDNSAMDGYAVRSADCTSANTVLRVAQRIAAGQFGQPLHAGEAARIFTGAPMPPGADAVVMQEDCVDVDVDVEEEEEEEEEVGVGANTGTGTSVGHASVRVTTQPSAGQWVRKAGEDIAKGRVVLPAGTLLGPAALGLAASIGLAELTVLRRAKVALFSTGDELVMPGTVAPEAMRPGSIYNSNRFFLRALLQRAGAQVTDMGIVPDNRAATVAALALAAQSHDLILTSGGVSVGEEDHIKPAVQQLGSLDLWSISMKPGKPFAYGRIDRGTQAISTTHFVGLPGNPVSSLVTFLLLVRPMLAVLQGQSVAATAALSIAACALFTWPKADKRREFLRARRNEDGAVDIYPNQSSGVLTSAVWADGLVDNPAGCTIAQGDTVRFIPFSELLG